MNGERAIFCRKASHGISAERAKNYMKRRVWVNDRGHVIGQDHHRAKLADADILQIVELRDAGLSWSAIAAKFDDIPGGVSVRQVRDICSGRKRAQTAVGTKLVGKG